MEGDTPHSRNDVILYLINKGHSRITPTDFPFSDISIIVVFNPKSMQWSLQQKVTSSWINIDRQNYSKFHHTWLPLRQINFNWVSHWILKKACNWPSTINCPSYLLLFWHKLYVITFDEEMRYVSHMSPTMHKRNIINWA